MNLSRWAAALLFMNSLWACSSSTEGQKAQQESVTTERSMEGYAPDEHGCNASAGETWSELHQTCLQIFDRGVRLNPTKKNSNEAVISAFVLFGIDSTKVELFLSTQETSLILERMPDGLYHSGDYLYDGQHQTLLHRGEAIYAGE